MLRHRDREVPPVPPAATPQVAVSRKSRLRSRQVVIPLAAAAVVAVAAAVLIAAQFRHPTPAATTQAQLPAPAASVSASPSPSGTPTATAPAVTAPSAPAVVVSTAPATSQRSEPAAAMAPGAQAYASGSLGTSSPAATASMYFGQLSSVMAALSSRITFDPLSSLLGENPDLCVSTVVFSGVSSPAGAVYGQGLGTGWTAAENAPSPNTQNGTLHQQLVVPPAGIPVGASWQVSAQLVTGSLTATSGRFGLQLESQHGAAQTWAANGQTVTCNS
jgi:hypothetical protein